MFAKEIFISSPLSPEEAIDRLKAVTIYSRSNSYDPKKTLFLGTVGLSSFHISPLLSYSGALFPRISGTITSAENGSELWATSRTLTFPKIFFLIWMAIVSFLVLFASIAVIRGGGPFWGPLIMLVIPGGGVLLAYFGYTVPERKAEECLQKLLQAE